MSAPLRTLLLGASGHFGSRIAQLLRGVPGVELAPLRRADLDLEDPHFARRLVERSPALVINAVGPFQSQDYRVARACIAAGSHYVDIADGREFVCGILALDEAARAANVCVVSGASSVPALSAAAIAKLCEGLGLVEAIDFGITTSSRPPGEATMRAILGGAGRPIPQRRGGKALTALGGMNGWVRSIEGVGARRFVPCDVPDLDLLPARYPGLESLRFGAGSESALSHAVLGAVARAVRVGMIADGSVLAGALSAAARRLETAGSGRSAMYVEVVGRTAQNRRVKRSWELLAGNEHGIHIPAGAAVALARRLACGALDARGAFPAAGLVSLEEYLAELPGLDIRIRASEDALS